ncbi:MAG: response regulator [Paracoccaceae bacterium]
MNDRNFFAHLLVVDDDERIRELLQKYLIRNGFSVSTARDADQARRLLGGLMFDLIILDVMMPGMDGVTFTSELRETLDTPILLLTARNETEDRISGLEAGADDYLAKPFEPKELLLRIGAILRRLPEVTEEQNTPKIISLGNVKYDVARAELWCGEVLVRLTSTEIDLMRLFSSNLGQPLHRTDIVQALNREAEQDRSIDVQITRLRRKIESDPKQPRYLQTVRGEGYMLVGD